MQIIIAFFILTGAFFFIVGTIGLIRLPDTYSRIHAPMKSDTLGVGLIMFGLILYNGVSVESVKIFFILIFIWMTNPTAGTAIARAIKSDVELTEKSFYYHKDNQESNEKGSGLN